MRLLTLEHPTDPETSFLVYCGPGFSVWYRLNLAADRVTDWERI